MELDEKTLKGHWSTDINRGIDFFIINDAIFSKLCILGEDVEPCFEGASVTAPEVSSTFSVNDKFTHTLFTMMKELKELTLNNKGGKSMPDNKEFVVLDSESAVVEAEAPVIEETVAEPVVEEPVVEEVEEKNIDISLETEDKTDLEDNIENKDIIEDSEEVISEGKTVAEEFTVEEPIVKESLEEKYSLLEQKCAELETKCQALEEENSALVAFKLQIENEKKDELINSFYMLSDEDKKSVIDNKANYTLDEIEKELSVICVRKKVNFNLDEEKTTETEEEVVPTTYNINEIEDDSLPAWLKAVEARRNAE